MATNHVDAPQQARTKSSSKTAVLYRMSMPGHLCPYGLKSKSLLKREGYEVEDHLLETRAQTDDYKREHHVETTPQTYIQGERIGGYSDLKKYFGHKVREEGDTSYTPVIAIFSATALMALALVFNLYDGFSAATWAKWFLAISMVVLAIQKLQDVEGFVNGFLGYDLLARRCVPYGYAYPFAELYTGVGMMALIGSQSWAIWMVAPVGIAIGAVGAASVIKAVYFDKRELTCACVGGGSTVPLGFISLSENLAMLGMGFWMLGAFAAG
ncbi:glutaredoxin [Pseudohalocynthiibacter aestuariivivens]|nr:glutaredoxin [Pseudohalocynthiibacter aestuariivivens]QIE46509.1 glutaredoxin [Pseudohalocynthiibacter aestuariivivens]